jgi:hypothetical protein
MFISLSVATQRLQYLDHWLRSPWSRQAYGKAYINLSAFERDHHGSRTSHRAIKQNLENCTLVLN